jgi:hypothetical protein
MRGHFWWRRAGAVLALVLAVAGSGGCGAALSAKPAGPTAPREFSTQIAVHDEALTLHLSSPRTPAADRVPLVLYASGDGGWFGAAVGMFHTIAGTGLPVVGFSTKAFMRIERRWSRPLRVAHIAEGYQEIIDAARVQLRVPRDCPVVLTGWSRGASLGLLVASSREVDPGVIGLVAIGLAGDEQLDIDGDSDEDEGQNRDVQNSLDSDLDGGAIAMYPLLSRIAPRRAVVIQATGDGYLPAAQARDLFGSDSLMKRLVAIDAHNHRFNGGESKFAAALIDAVSWVASSAEDSK